MAAGAGEKGDDVRSEVKSEKPSEQASNAGIEAPGRGVKREAGPVVKQESKKFKMN